MTQRRNFSSYFRDQLRMTRLPPLANLIAIREPGADALKGIEARLLASGLYSEIWQPHSQWIVAVAYLPDSEPDPATARANGLAFAQGRDEIEHGHRDLNSRFEQVARLTASTPEKLAQLPGDFAFLQFGTDGSASAVRSAGGLVPLYCWHTPQRSAISTRLDAIPRFAHSEARLDPLTCAAWIGGGWPLFIERRSFLKDIVVIGRGEVGLVDQRKPLRVVAYWSSQPPHYPKWSRGDEQEHTEAFRSILLRTLSECLHSRAGNVISLSGGVDSSALVSVAKGYLERDVWTWSLLPGAGPDLERDRAYIRALLDKYSISRHWQVYATDETYEALEQASPKTVFPGTWHSVGGLAQIAREARPTVFCTGHFADELCGSAFTTPDWALATSPIGLALTWGRYPRGPKDVMSWFKYRLRRSLSKPTLHYPTDLRSYIQPTLREEYRGWVARHALQLARGNWTWQYFETRVAADGWLANVWEGLTALSVRPLFPFVTREMFDLHAKSHPAELVGPGPKRLLRRALHGLVPEANLYRPDKGRWSNLGLAPELPRPKFLSTECREIMMLDQPWAAKPTWPRLEARFAQLLNGASEALHNARASSSVN